MSEWTLADSRQAQKDAKRVASSDLKQRAERLLDVLAEDPFGTPARYEKAVGDLSGCYSRRINIQHLLVYEIFPDRDVVHVLRIWTHHEWPSPGVARVNRAASGSMTGLDSPPLYGRLYTHDNDNWSVRNMAGTDHSRSRRTASQGRGTPRP